MPILPEIATCDELPEDECEAIAEITEGEAAVVIHPSTKCNKRLANKILALLVSDGSKVWFADGSTGDEIKLDLKELGVSAPVLVASNASKELGSIPATPGCIPHILVAQDGSFELVPYEAPQCWEDVCEEPPTQFAGLIPAVDCEGNEVFCLRRFDFEQMIHFASSSCIEFGGAGTLEDPYVFTPIISADDGNILECRGTGLYVPEPSLYGTDPVDEL